MMPLVNDLKGLAACLSPTLVVLVPSDQTMDLLRLIAIIFSIICSTFGIAWYIYKFLTRNK